MVIVYLIVLMHFSLENIVVFYTSHVVVNECDTSIVCALNCTTIVSECDQYNNCILPSIKVCAIAVYNLLM